MTDLPDLIREIDSAWEDLATFVAGLGQDEATRVDASGWTVADHLIHIAVWEDSVAVLFRGGRRHEALGISEALYSEASFDAINQVIQKRYPHVPLAEAFEHFERVHDELMGRVRALSETDLQTSVRDKFPLVPRSDDRTLLAFLHENTAAHVVEHLAWMRELAAKGS